MWSVSTILTGLYSFMIETAPTLGSIDSSTREKKQFAAKSLAHNVNDPVFCRLFPEYVEQYQASAAAKAAEETSDSDVATLESGALIRNDRLEFHRIMAAGAGFIAIFSVVLAALRFF